MSKGDTGGNANAGRARAPRLYTVAPGTPFLDTLARAILEGDLPVAGGTPPGALDLAGWTILLPTRRAARALGEAFLRVSGDAALLLPRVRPLGDVDEDALALGTPSEFGGDAERALSLPPAISNMERRLALTRLILQWSRSVSESAAGEGVRTPATPAQASSLAVQLAALMDTLDTEQVCLEGLKGLVPDRFADHWQKTLAFLEIVTKHWPEYLDEKGVMAPFARRNELMKSETWRLVSNPPDAPVIAAGSTATVPATAALLEAVARLGNGAVVLPGLDMDLDEDSWKAISGPDPHPEHPQFGMQQFLTRLGVSRADVTVLGAGGTDARARIVSHAMRPAATTEKWQALRGGKDGAEMAGALDGVARIDAPTEQDEAEAISLLLRHAAEVPGHTAALVTPDRTLARRVSARLGKWGLDVDDSAGVPLDKTLPGSFMDALAEAAGSGFAPVPLLALLKHPLTLLGREPGEMRRAARLLELTAFRQPAAGKGFEAHRRAVKRMRERAKEKRHVHPVVGRLGDRDWSAVDLLLDDIEAALAPLTGLFAGPGGAHSLEDLARAHVEAGQALAADKAGGYAALWRGDAGEALASLFESLLAAGAASLGVQAADYPELYRSFVAGIPVRPRAPAHPRIYIWGPLEARLQRPDMVVLGGLNEGTWPATVETDPWLSRPMRDQIGLSAPERRIGLAAHDFAQLMGAGEVWLTRAKKAGGAPTVPSRWLLRLGAVLDALGMDDVIRADQQWLAWARARDVAQEAAPIAAPAPCPPAAARPKQLSVTRIEAWIANPYAIFARDILRLGKLDDLAGEPDAALKGTLVHDAMMRFAEAHPGPLPNDIAAELMRHARSLFAEFGDSARIRTFWEGQFNVFARWFAATEPGRRTGVEKVIAEVRGELRIGGADGFTLTARADRIDVCEGGALRLYDYKTGAPPTATAVEKGRAPQLPLEAAIAQSGGFAGVAGAPVSRLAYIRTRGYGEGGEQRDACPKAAPDALAADALEHLHALVAAYRQETQPYRAMRRPVFASSSQYRYDDYAHLARVQEWQAAGEGDD